MSRDRDIIYSGAPAFSLAVVQKIEDTDISLAIGTQIYSGCFLDSSKSKANDLENGFASYTFFC